MRLVLIAALTAPLALAALPAAARDGAALFNAQCKSCHSVTAASGPAGPSLKGVVGRKIAGAPGYAYSTGLKAKTGTWGDANLDAFLANPAAFAPCGFRRHRYRQVAGGNRLCGIRLHVVNLRRSGGAAGVSGNSATHWSASTWTFGIGHGFGSRQSWAGRSA